MSRTIRFHKFGPAEVLKCEEHAAALPAPGEVQGERPYSWVKIALAVTAASLVVWLISWVVSHAS